MITVVSDTHGTDGHRLEGRTLEAVREADLVLHAGDYTTETALDAFQREAGTAAGDGPVGEANSTAPERRVVDAAKRSFVGVYGNNDGAGIRGRLGAVRVVDLAGGVGRIVLVHGHEHDETRVGFLGRQEGADLVVVGHSHRPEARRIGAVTMLNPGSHADPRWHRPAHAELESTAEGLHGRLVQPDGTVISEFDLSG